MALPADPQRQARGVAAVALAALLTNSLAGCPAGQPPQAPRVVLQPQGTRSGASATTLVPPGAPILLGQSAPLSGPSGTLGWDFASGAQSLFRQVNSNGGINGRPIRLIQLDDRYEPALTRANAAHLLNQDKVFALFGTVGTATTQTVLPLLEQWGIPLVAPVTGAALLRSPGNSHVFHLRTSYADEAERIVAFLAQADLVAGKRPDAVVAISTYGTVASLVRELNRRQSHPQLMTVSFVGTGALFKALPDGKANGIGVTQVVPFPWNGQMPVVRD